MDKPIRIIICAAVLVLNANGVLFSQDEDLPYNPFLEKGLKTHRPASENKALRDLGHIPMDTIVRIPAEIKKKVQVIKNAASARGQPIVILVYGRKDALPHDSGIAGGSRGKDGVIVTGE